MPLSVGLILVFMLGFWSGMAYLRASRLDRADKLVKTIASQRETIAALRSELGEQRRSDLYAYLFEDDPE